MPKHSVVERTEELNSYSLSGFGEKGERPHFLQGTSNRLRAFEYGNDILNVTATINAMPRGPRSIRPADLPFLER